MGSPGNPGWTSRSHEASEGTNPRHEERFGVPPSVEVSSLPGFHSCDRRTKTGSKSRFAGISPRQHWAMFVPQPSLSCAHPDNTKSQSAHLQAHLEAGATGLEPATSGVTGRFEGHDDKRRLARNRSIHAAFRALRDSIPHG
jgi:hypothetical protein